MQSTKRATVYLDADLHKALKLRAANDERSISEIVNDAVRLALAEDAEDLAAARERRRERAVTFESFVATLKKRGRL